MTPPAQSAGDGGPAEIGFSLSRQQVSPNGDGRKDAVVLRFRLPAAARATVLARRIGMGGEPVTKRIHLGRRPRGANTWRFDGRDARGKVLPDGFYEGGRGGAHRPGKVAEPVGAAGGGHRDQRGSPAA